MAKLEFVYDDGGRSKYFKGVCGDCVTRAFAIASGRDYKEVYNEIRHLIKASPRDGVTIKDIRKYCNIKGYEWIPLMKIGSGCTNHLAQYEIPMEGNIVCNLSGHNTAVIDGVIHDIYDPSRDGNRCVYGYWIVK